MWVIARTMYAAGFKRATSNGMVYCFLTRLGSRLMNAAKLYPIMHEFIHVHVTAVVLAAASLNVHVYLPKRLVGTNVCVRVWR